MTLMTPTPVASTLFELDCFSVEFQTAGGVLRAVDRVSYAIGSGETLGIVGESGSGKTVSALAGLGLLSRRTPYRLSGSVRFDDIDLLTLNDAERRRYLGSQIGVIFQEPTAALDPVQRIGDQIAEALRLHDRRLSRRAAWARAAELLSDVGVADAGRRLNQYPHQFSGGMCQRVVIAIAMANRPRLLIADEPTTAVDVTVQAQLLELLRQVRQETGAAVLLITHDLGVVAETVDRVGVMYAGGIVEEATVDEFFDQPRHPYSRGLIGSQPQLGRSGSRLVPIPGMLPDLRDNSSGCRFEPRCAVGHGRARCIAEQPRLTEQETGVRVACHFADEVAVAAPHMVQEVSVEPAGEPLLRLQNVVKHFPVRSSILRREIGQIRAVDGVELTLRAGETLALVGESGSGKSTAGRLALRLLEASGGTVELDGADLRTLNAAALRRARATMQIVFQDPFSSLNPRLSAADNIVEPLRIHGVGRAERRRRVLDLLSQVGLRSDHADRKPAEFSGGQRQRIGIARALALQPKLIVLDEPVASLDVSVQAQIVNLLQDLQERHRLSYLFISHDLAVVRHLSHRIAVMYLGRIVESGSVADIFDRPAHPYTKALLSAVPEARRDGRRVERIVLAGEPPSPLEVTRGCRFRSRCWKATQVCADVDPELSPVTDTSSGSKNEHRAACHHPEASQIRLVKGGVR